MIALQDLDYPLPPERIAQEPVSPRDAARLLVVDRASSAWIDRRFRELPLGLRPHDLLVVNDTRVMPARVRAHKPSGGRIELLLIELVDAERWRALVKSTGRLRPGLQVNLGDPIRFSGTIEAIEPDGTCMLYFRVAPDEPGKVDEIPSILGEIPLPPYIRSGRARASDSHDYQTVFATSAGSVAAPTASLHFTPELARRLSIAKVTLHVGPGTFRPIRAERIDDHRLEPERFEISKSCAEAMQRARARGGRVIAVGTTVVRALETTGGRAGSGRTDLLIQPGHRFRAIDSLITNFHLPRSSLLALVMAFAGTERVRRAYAHAIASDYRFYSYGDAMWVI